MEWSPEREIPEGERPDPFRPLLDHAVRQWQAEEENARRLTRRVNLQLTVIAAFLGLGVFRLADGPVVSPPWLSVSVRGLLMAGLTSLAWAALVLLALSGGGGRLEKMAVKLLARIKRRAPVIGRLIGRKPRRKPASTKLGLSSTDIEDLTGSVPPIGTERYSRFLAFERTAEAAVDLQEQNLLEGDKISRAQVWIVIGFAFLLLGLLGYSFASEIG